MTVAIGKRRLSAWIGPEWPAAGASGAAGMLLGTALGGLPASWMPTLAGASVALYGVSDAWRRRRNRVMRRRGTIYVIRETAHPTWTDDRARAEDFIGALRRDFPEVRVVPGPCEFRCGQWLLGVEAPKWDRWVDELVLAIRGAQVAERPEFAKSMVWWAWAPVAIATMARLGWADGSHGLEVRQRPSAGRQATIEMVNPRQRSLRFPPIPGGPTTGTLVDAVPPTIITRGLGLISRDPSTTRPPVSASVVEWPAIITVTPRGSPSVASTTQRPVSVLLIRSTGQAWGPLSPLETQRDPVPGGPPIDVTVDDARGIGISGPVAAKIIEWRCSPPPGASQHRWEDYEAIAQAASNWIAQQASRLNDHVLLLGSTMPQEIGVGIGIHLARADTHQWPEHLWPLVWSLQRDFVIPNLDLGWASTHPDRTV